MSWKLLLLTLIFAFLAFIPKDSTAISSQGTTTEVLRNLNRQHFGDYYTEQNLENSFELGCTRYYHAYSEYSGAIVGPTHELIVSGTITCPENVSNKSLNNFVSSLTTPILKQLVENGDQFNYSSNYQSVHSKEVYHESYGSKTQNDERKLYLFKQGSHFVLAFYVCKPCGMKVLDFNDGFVQFLEDVVGTLQPSSPTATSIPSPTPPPTSSPSATPKFSPTPLPTPLASATPSPGLTPPPTLVPSATLAPGLYLSPISFLTPKAAIPTSTPRSNQINPLIPILLALIPAIAIFFFVFVKDKGEGFPF